MKILVTGSNGFVGRNLVVQLKNQGYTDILEYDMGSSAELLDEYTHYCDFVYHLAGINRPENPSEFMRGNFGFTSELLKKLKKYGNKSPVLMTSSTQAALDNPYGKSKKEGEELLFLYEKETGARTLIYRLSNIFGKWCRPNYNSAVATFCHNIARDLPIQVNNPDTDMRLVYIDDVVSEFISALDGAPTVDGLYCVVEPVYAVKLGMISDMLTNFHGSRASLCVPQLGNEFEKKLYSTYLSYIPEDKFSYPLNTNTDLRGSFTEFIRTPDRGQFSVNVSKPGIAKGNHWHHTKNEKFLVVKGSGSIRLRRVGGDEVIEYLVSGDKLEVVDIPPGYTHSIVNTGAEDMVTIVWANECYDSNNADTYFLEV